MLPYGPPGSVLQVVRVGGVETQKILAVEVDEEGSIYTAGSYASELAFDNGSANLGGRESRPFVAKFSLDETCTYKVAWVWVASPSSGGAGVAQALHLANGRLFVGGYFRGTLSMDSLPMLASAEPSEDDGFIAELSPQTGMTLQNAWAGADTARIPALTSDDAGNLFAAGRCDSTDRYGIWLSRHSIDDLGLAVMTCIAPSQSNAKYTEALDVGFDSGLVVVGGAITGPLSIVPLGITDRDGLLAAFQPLNLQEMWSLVIGNVPDTHDVVDGLAVLPDHRIAIGGVVRNPSGNCFSGFLNLIRAYVGFVNSAGVCDEVSAFAAEGSNANETWAVDQEAGTVFVAGQFNGNMTLKGVVVGPTPTNDAESNRFAAFWAAVDGGGNVLWDGYALHTDKEMGQSRGFSVAAGPEIVVVGGDTKGAGVEIGGVDFSSEDYDGFLVILHR